ncbi:hypothetical protein Q7P36_006222 [Cladosporium allicinum]
MNRQEENAVVDSIDPQAKDRLVALLAEFQQLVDDYSHVAVERSRIFAGARDATKAATAAFESNNLSAAEVYARVTRIKTETGIAARAQKHPQTRNPWPATFTQLATSNNNSPDETAYSIQPNDEPTTVPVEPPTVAAEPSTTNVTKAKTIDDNDDQKGVDTKNVDDEKDDDDAAASSPPDEFLPPNSPQQEPLSPPEQHTRARPMLGAIFLKDGEEVFFIAVLVFVSTVFVPLCWSYRVFTCFIASYVTVIAAFVSLLVVGLILEW